MKSVFLFLMILFVSAAALPKQAFATCLNITSAPIDVVINCGAIPDNTNPNYTGNTSNDDTQAIQDAIDSAQDGQEIVFPVGVYHVSGLVVDKPVALRGYGGRSDSAAAILMSTSDTPIITLDSGSNGTFLTNLTLRGKDEDNNPVNTVYPCLEVLSKSLKFDSLNIQCGGGDGIKFNGANFAGEESFYSHVKVSNVATDSGNCINFSEEGTGANSVWVETHLDSCENAIRFYDGGGNASNWFGLTYYQTEGLNFDHASDVYMKGVHTESINNDPVVSFSSDSERNQIHFSSYHNGTIVDNGTNNTWTGLRLSGGSNIDGHPWHRRGKAPELFLEDFSGSASAKIRLKGEGVESQIAAHGGGLNYVAPSSKDHTFVVGTSDRLKVNSSGINVLGTVSINGSYHADYVFEPHFDLESIDEHANYMWQEKHLKAIPSAKSGDNIDLGKRQQNIIEELEKAHIYIEQLNKRLKALEFTSNTQP